MKCYFFSNIKCYYFSAYGVYSIRVVEQVSHLKNSHGCSSMYLYCIINFLFVLSFNWSKFLYYWCDEI